MMLVGTWEQPIDSSGLLNLPSALRPLLADGLIATRGFDLCLQLFPLASWRALATRVSTLPLGGSTEPSLRRLLFAAACALADEGNALVRLPRQLLDYAAITTRVVIVGLHSHLEIWTPDRWIALNAEITRAAGRWPDSALSLSIPTI
jgi:MraZ protein